MYDYNSFKFAVLVAGDNPVELMSKYDSRTNRVKPYVAYEYAKREEYKKKWLSLYGQKTGNGAIDVQTKYIEYISPEKFFFDYLNEDKKYFVDPKTKNLMYNVDPNTKFDYYSDEWVSIYKNEKGECIQQALKKDVDFEKIIKEEKRIYGLTWDLIVDGKEPTTDEEKEICEVMKGMRYNIEHFYENKEDYVETSGCFRAYAFLSEETGWVQPDKAIDLWNKEYYERFIKKLPEDTKLTMYYCERRN